MRRIKTKGKVPTKLWFLDYTQSNALCETNGRKRHPKGAAFCFIKVRYLSHLLAWYHCLMKETFTVKEEGIQAMAEKVVEFLSTRKTPRAKVVLLEGDLGAGKTTFTKELANALGIEKEEVHSPTFILKKEYIAAHPDFRKLVHIDAYRFLAKDEDTILKLENDLENSTNVIAIEWPEKMNHPKADIRINFSVIDDDTREVSLMYETLRESMSQS